jgi:chemotaxis protein MotB
MAKRKKRSGSNGLDPMGWMTTFTDLVTLLMTFFVLLNSIAVIDEERERLALNSFIGSLGFMKGGLSPMENKARSMLPPSAPMEKAIEGAKLVEQLLMRRVTTGLTVAGRGLRRVISIQDGFFFDPGSYRLKPEARSVLKEVAPYVNLTKFPVQIEGHTDDLPELPPGISSDWELSALRAQAVLRCLMDDGKVAPNRLSAFGYGRHRPLAPNNSKLNSAKNRRVTLILDEREEALQEYVDDRRSRPMLYDFKGFLFRIFRGS